jgi:hypothetical protein
MAAGALSVVTTSLVMMELYRAFVLARNESAILPHFEQSKWSGSRRLLNKCGELAPLKRS